jgi:hypothetical protein
MASSSNFLFVLGTLLYCTLDIGAVSLDVGLDICIPFGVEVGLFIDLFERPQVTEVVPFFTTLTSIIPSESIYTIPPGISPATVTASRATELCVTSVMTKTTTFPCITSTFFLTTWWDSCKASSTSGTFRWTPSSTSISATVTSIVTATTTAIVTETATSYSATTSSTPNITTSSSSITTSTPTPTLSCDPYGYLIQYATLYRVDLATGDATEIASRLGDHTSINVIGYNTLASGNYGAWCVLNLLTCLLYWCHRATALVAFRLDSQQSSSVFGSFTYSIEYVKAKEPMGSRG